MNGCGEPDRLDTGGEAAAAIAILCGVRIGKSAMVGAGAVVTRDVPAGGTVVSNPARPVKPR